MEPQDVSPHGSSILLVEDEDVARLSIARMLTIRFPGVPVYSAADGRSGLELYRRHLPALVITDINMPRLNGLEMVRAIRAESPRAQIIVMSAYSQPSYRAAAAQSGVCHYLVKPVDRNDLFSAVGCCLKRSGG